MTLNRHATEPVKTRAIANLDRGALTRMALATLAVAAALASAPMPARADAFSALKGGWSGGGNAKFTGGESEKLRCTARYSGGGASLALNIKCASTSANINLTGNLSASGNKVSGGWNENSFGLSGSAWGSKSDNSVRLKINGSTTGYLTLSVVGNRHSFALSSQGTALTGVNVSMRRR
jgi:hypothetical protein